MQRLSVMPAVRIIVRERMDCFLRLVTGMLWLAIAAVCPAQGLVLLQHADPFLTAHAVNGRYLLLATAGRNITIWNGSTPAQAAGDPHVVFTPANGLAQLWSPTLWQMEGSWWIYFTARMPDEEHAIYVLQSDSADPLGTYTFRGKLDVGQPAIDPSVLMVKDKPYLMYASITGGGNAVWIVQLKHPMKTKGGKSKIGEAQYPWERGNGDTEHIAPINEGPTALYHAGQTFIVYSASDTASAAYCLGLLTYRGGNPTKAKSWVKTDHPLFAQNPAAGIVGPGRGTFAEAADGTWWLLYAAMPANHPDTRHRAIHAQTFTWNADGTPNFGTPQAAAEAQ